MSSYNQSVLNKVHSYLFAFMIKECNSNGEEIKRVMNECKKYEKIFLTNIESKFRRIHNGYYA